MSTDTKSKTGYAIKNLKQDVKDSAVEFGMSPALESRFAKDDLGCEQVGISYQRIGPNEHQPFAHRHKKDEEVYVVLSGSGRMKLDDDEVEIERWDAIRVSPPTLRAFAAGPDGLEVLAFGPRTPDDPDMQPDAFEDD
jgi:uncharacterized cupin superfamily protein